MKSTSFLSYVDEHHTDTKLYFKSQLAANVILTMNKVLHEVKRIDMTFYMIVVKSDDTRLCCCC